MNLGLNAAKELSQENKLNKKRILKSFEEELNRGIVAALQTGAKKRSPPGIYRKLKRKPKKRKAL